ncbi:MAG: glucosaminidase domain-containing protein [Alphaproteobacteria bacterium]
MGQRIGFDRFALGLLFLAIGGLMGSVVLGQASLPATPLLERAPLERPVAALKLSDAEALAATFGSQDYRLDRVRQEGVVPRLFLATLPGDLEAIRAVRERKRLFLQTMLPLILHVNETITEQRKRVLALTEAQQRGVRLASKDADWLRNLYAYYRVEEGNLSELLRRVDVIPPSLALAQAAEESGWGTSRFAQEGNAIFGQWTPSLHRGLVPLERGEEARYAVRSFRDLVASVRAYARNLNTHKAYRELRAKRENLRRRDVPLNGYTLAGTLQHYSERGEAYVETLRSLIRSNKLRHFDRAKLQGDVYASLPESGA